MSLEEYFQGKKVLVTGGSRGLGRALVEKLHKYGAKVYALSAMPNNLEKLKEDFPGVETICVDISNWDETRKAVSQLETIDCLVNNAAKFVPKSVMTATPEDFDDVYSVNVKGLMYICQIIATKLIETGKSGSIVNVTSIGEHRPWTVSALYCTSKGAVQNMSQALALELGPHNIRVNTVAPALMDTEMGADFTAAVKKGLGNEGMDDTEIHNAVALRNALNCPNASMPIDKVANSILFLLSDVCGPVTGQRLAVDAGYLLS